MDEIDKLFNAAMAWPGSGSVLVTREQLTALAANAFKHGGACMADQISEDFFGGHQEFKPQYENPYLAED